jgi:hypothetical protein
MRREGRGREKEEGKGERGGKGKGIPFRSRHAAIKIGHASRSCNKCKYLSVCVFVSTVSNSHVASISSVSTCDA